MSPEAILLQNDILRVLTRDLNVTVAHIDAELIGTGLLDSLALVDLIAHLESQFGISIPLDCLDIDVFRSVAHIADFVTELQFAA
jgi:acyl carrier protein